MNGSSPPSWLMVTLVTAQLFATGLWFAPNAVIGELQAYWSFPGGEGIVTTAVQLGFITGTLTFAVLAVADRFRPGNVFLVSALVGAAANASVLLFPDVFSFVLCARFLVGFCLAGVYPVGMKIAASWYGGGLGRALGYLVGALVLGSASPHLLSGVGAHLDWRLVLLGTSALAVVGALLARLIPEGPYLKRGGPVRFSGVLQAFRVPHFRAAVLGYFGHMWELYAFWAFIPVWLLAYGTESGRAVSLATFAIIGLGAVGCAAGGVAARRLGSGRIALGQLSVSAMCCLLSPLIFLLPPVPFALVLMLWGITVVGDSPQFSTLNARYAPQHLVGSALTLTNCIGFAISVGSLALLDWLQFRISPDYLLLVLVPGPILGLMAGRILLREPATEISPQPGVTEHGN